MAAPDRLPFNREAEQAVLGSIFHNNDALLAASEVLTPDSFFSSAHRDIFAEMLRTATDREPIDEVTLAARLKANGQLDGCGGIVYLAELGDTTPVSTNVLAYAEIVAECADKRELIAIGTRLSEDGRGGKIESLDLAARVEDTVRALSHKRAGLMSETIEAASTRTAMMLTRIEDRPVDIRTHTFLDQHIGGFTNDFVSIVGARTGNGKTAFLLHALLENARRGVPGLFISMEMRNWQCVARMACNEAAVNGTKVMKRRFNSLTRDQQAALLDGFVQVGQMPIRLAGDGRRLTLGQIRHIARHMVNQAGARVVMLDHLSKIIVPGPGSMYEKQTERIVSLSELAKELGVVFLVAAQINREGDDVPRVKDLEGSDAIGQEADAVILLQRRPKPDADRKFWVDCHLAKQRDGGPTEATDAGSGPITVRWWPWIYRFEGAGDNESLGI